MYYDLHTHTVWSDGELSPEALVSCAAQAGVQVLALTDHDTVAGLAAGAAAARVQGIVLVSGVEISVSWQGLTVHVVGLDIDPTHESLQRGLERLQGIRRERALAIVQALARVGLGDARPLLARDGVVSRTHIADWLVEQGHARDRGVAFKRFLTRGSPAYVSVIWADLAEAVGWIRAAGGCAVLAHPTRYRLSSGRLQQLVRAFSEGGGAALEVVTAGLDAGEIGRLARLAECYGLQASVGSDYHKALPWRPLPGGLPELPEACVPIWQKRPRMQARLTA
ncbi:MAG: PHP domain-containing protein [Acidiferrobacter sp.]